MSRATDIRQKRLDLYNAMNEAAGLNGCTRDLVRHKQLTEQFNDLTQELKAVEQQEEIARDMERVRDPQRPEINAGPYAESSVHQNRGKDLIEEVRSSASYSKDFARFLRTGVRSEQLQRLSYASPELMGGQSLTNRAILGEGSDVSGGTASTLVPQGFEYELEIKLKAIGGMRRVCRILKTATGQVLPYPTLDDTSNIGEWLSEGSATTLNVNPTISNVVLYANLVSSKQVQVSVQLEQDSAFDLPALLSDAFAIRIARATESAYVNGNGSGQPTGLITAITGNGNAVLPVGANADSGNAANTEINSLGAADFANLIAQLDPLYRPKAKFMANQSTWDSVRTILDKYGRPLWAVSLAAGVPDKLLGYDYDYSQYFPVIAAGAVGTVVFGDFSKYVIRDVTGVTLVRFNETYMANYNRGYQAFLRTDGQCLQTAAFAYFQTRAS